jgi:oligopeptide/dipeptide ABC transporter ATP-binding protein
VGTRQMSGDKWVARLVPALAGLVATLHSMTNPLATIEGATAAIHHVNAGPSRLRPHRRGLVAQDRWVLRGPSASCFSASWSRWGRRATRTPTPRIPTQALIDTIPVPDPTSSVAGRHIRGELPSSVDPPSGCRFRTRCPFAKRAALRRSRSFDLSGRATWRPATTRCRRLRRRPGGSGADPGGARGTQRRKDDSLWLGTERGVP